MQSEAKAKALEQFTDYFVRNYPGPDTIIYDPKWHAPKIFAAAYSAISAALSDKQAGEVKALEWTKTALHDPYGLIIRVAQTRFGAYRILKGSQDRFSVNFGSVPFSGAMDNLDEALTWAQADYEQRIRSALVDVPAEPVAWQRRQQYSEIPGYVPQWQFVSKEEATGHFERRPGYEYRPLYTSPPLSREGEDSAEVGRALAFVARWAWREDPSNAVRKLTDAERLSAIKHHPTIKALAATRSASATASSGDQP